MKLVVLGANGRTGKLVVQQALANGDHVTAVVRPTSLSLDLQHENLRIAKGDCCDASFLAELFEGQDAVISTLGGRSPTKEATSIYWRSAEAIVAAANLTGLRHVTVTSTALLFPDKGVLDSILAAIVRNVVKSAARMEATLCEADINLVVARCGWLTDKQTNEYRYEMGRLPRQGSSIARLGLARFLLDATHDMWSGVNVYGVSDQKRLPLENGHMSAST